MKKPTGDAYHHGDLRRALLEAALALIEQGGIEGLSLRAVARKAGVSHNAPYHHFPDRAGLLAAIAEEGFAQLAREIAAARAAAPAPRARMQACGLAYIRFALGSPARFKLMFRPELAPTATDGAANRAAAATLETLRGAIVEGQAAGLAPAGDPLPLVLTSWAAAHGLAALWLDGPLRRAPLFAGLSGDALAARLTSTLAGLMIDAAVSGPKKRRRA